MSSPKKFENSTENSGDAVSTESTERVDGLSEASSSRHSSGSCKSDQENVRYPNRVIVGAQRRAASFREAHNASDSASNDSRFSSDSAQRHTLMYSNAEMHDEAPLVDPDDDHDTHCSGHNKFQYNPHARDENVLRRRIKYFFMNPMDKWRAKGRLPWKLFVQIIKIVIITIEVLHYGMENSDHVRQHSSIAVSFKEIFLPDWDTVREVMAYPPQSGPYAVYTKDQFYAYIDRAILKLSNLNDISIGSFGFSTNSSTRVSPIYFCKRYYLKGRTDPSTFTYIYDKTVVDNCTRVDVHYPPGDQRWQKFSIQKYLESKNMTVNFDTLLEASVMFDVRVVYLNSQAIEASPKCFTERVSIVFDNSLHDGQMIVSLVTEATKEICSGKLTSYFNEAEYYLTLMLNILVIVICSLSFLMCLISLYKGAKLQRVTVAFFEKRYSCRLSFGDRLQFIDFWIVTIILNDILVIFGSLLKMKIEYKQRETFPHDGGAILLGVGILLVWIGILRYFSFFKKYNLIILALKRAIPDVLRFSLCAGFLYGYPKYKSQVYIIYIVAYLLRGFCICGWVVLGPYHIKFRTLSTTSECLFALLNGDDMFATFAVLSTSQTLIWWFCRIYLYSFISLFIYVVLNLFISLILDGYETIKEYYEHGFPLSDLQRFVAECKDDPTSASFQEDDDETLGCIFRPLFCYFRRLRRR